MNRLYVQNFEKLLALHPAITSSEIESESQWCLGVQNPAFSNSMYIYLYKCMLYYIFFGFRVQCRNKKPLDYPGFALSKTSLRVLVVLGG